MAATILGFPVVESKDISPIKEGDITFGDFSMYRRRDPVRIDVDSSKAVFDKEKGTVTMPYRVCIDE